MSTIRRSSSACSALVSLRSARRFGFFGLGVCFRRLQRRNRLLGCFRLLQHLRVDVQDALRVAQLVDVNAPGSKAYLTRAAVSVRLQTVIITGGVGRSASSTPSTPRASRSPAGNRR